MEAKIMHSQSNDLIDWQAALDLIQAYSGNQEYVPQEVIIVNDIRKPDAGRSLNKRALMYVVSDAQNPLAIGDINLEFSDTLKSGFVGKRKKTDLPDVYVGSMYAAAANVPQTFSISGANNLIFGGYVSAASNLQHTFHLQAEGSVAIMDGARIGFESPGSLEAGGDIVQYGGDAKFGTINGGHNYTKYGGRLLKPRYMERGQPAVVHLKGKGKFQNLGGEEQNPLEVKIEDADTEATAEAALRPFAHEYGFELPERGSPSGVAHRSGEAEFSAEPQAETPSELADRFKEQYKPSTNIRRVEDDNSVTITQTHVIAISSGNIQDLINFNTLALAAGCTIANQTIAEGRAIMTLQRNEKPSTAPTEPAEAANE